MANCSYNPSFRSYKTQLQLVGDPPCIQSLIIYIFHKFHEFFLCELTGVQYLGLLREPFVAAKLGKR